MHTYSTQPIPLEITKKKTFEFEKRNFSSVNGLRDVSVINRLPISIIFSLRKIIGIKYNKTVGKMYYVRFLLFALAIFNIYIWY